MNDRSIRSFECLCDCRDRDYPSPVTGPEDQQLCIYICHYLLLIYQGISSIFNASAVREPVVPTLLTPRTGEQMKVWSGPPVPKAIDFLLQLYEFLDRYSLNVSARNLMAKRKGGTVT